MKRFAQVAAGLGAALAGAAAAVFLHPRAGVRNRRAAATAARRQSANVAAILGTSVERATPSRRANSGDGSIAEAVRDVLVERFPAAAGDLQVTCQRGTVTLRGEVPRLRDIDILEAAAREVGGVRDVNNLLRLPNQDRRASGEARPPVSSAP